MPNPLQSAKRIFRGSGPYRRVWSDRGFIGVEATIRLPVAGTMTVVADPPFDDTVYTYTGGWGEDGHAVDAGLQHSREHDDWCLFVASARKGEKSYTESKAPRFTAGTVVRLRFEVVGPNQLIVVADANDGHGERRIEWGADKGVYGWGREGNQIFKRMVSIAQCKKVSGETKNIDRFDSGTVARSIRWEDVKLIERNGSRISWASGHGGSHNHPSKPPHDKHFEFVWADFNAETVSIDLR